MIDIDVTVMPKVSVLDPQGAAVARSLRSLGHVGVTDVRIGRHIELSLECDDEQQALTMVEEMCELLLVNPVIESYTVGVPRSIAVLEGGTR